MDNEEAAGLLEEELAVFRKESYADLARRIAEGSLDYERTASNGRKYHIEIQFFWDNHPGGNIRVVGSIDNGGWRAFVPLNRDFIKSGDDSFVGE